MLLLFFYLFLALFVSFLCSVMESVLLSTPISFLTVKKEKGSYAAGTFIALKKNVEKPLAAILSLNTVAHTIGAAGVGAQATRIYGEAYFGIVSAILTLLILIFSEIIPKTIGARYWRSLALASGIIIKGLVWITYPLVLLTGLITKMFSPERSGLSVSREEISAMATIGTEEGVIEEKEKKIIQNVVRLRNYLVKEVMTPRVVVTVADETMPARDFLSRKEYSYYSRIPVYSENKDNITGYVFRQNAFEELAGGSKEISLKSIRRDIVVVPEFQNLITAWEMLLKSKEHIALIVDEYGGMEGIVTMEDIVETLLGLEIVDERDRITDMQQYARQRWEEKRSKFKDLSDAEE